MKTFVISQTDIKNIVNRVGINTVMDDLIARIRTAYSQKIAVDGDSIFKDYYFEKDGELLTHQRINHRFYDETTFLSLIEGVGLQFHNFDQSDSYGIF